MSKLMLIDAAHPEETRVAVVADGQIEDFDFEARDKRQLRGNIYLAKVTRVEPSLQAAFVEYGGNRHGFLAFSEIHPDYYQIPAEDREALLREQAESDDDDDEDDDDDVSSDASEDQNDDSSSDSSDSDSAAALYEGTDDSIDLDTIASEADETDNGADSPEGGDDVDAASDDGSDSDDDDDDDDDNDETASVRKKRRRVHPSKRYKIQEVIKRRQVMLIQVVKEERGNKGAAVTTYLSLAGRYGVLMPNTARGGGISRKITNASDRKRLKSITREFEIPDGMGLIIRTAGAKRTKAEISRDYVYLTRLWKRICEKTMKSSAPCLIHEEGDLVLRAVRDLYDREVKQICVQGKEAYTQASNVVDMLMPDQSDLVVEHDKKTPLFINYGVEAQLDNIFSPTVTLPSGGYIVINQTEALVAIDVNSGKATRERNIETTALKTNLEAAEEACRQMRLRDLAGLIVIDFIDMEENKNNRAVEKKMKECLSIDRARVQAGRISQFGLFEISRQRRRAGVLELSSEPCPHCTGTGRTRSIESAALQLLRAIGERCADTRVELVKVQAPKDVALYILNHKRATVTGMEDDADVTIRIAADDELMSGDFNIEASADGKTIAYKPVLPEPPRPRRRQRSDQSSEARSGDGLEVIDDEDAASDDDEDGAGSGGRRRRGRRGGRRRRGGAEDANVATDVASADEDDDSEEKSSGRNRRRRRRTRKRVPDVAIDGGEMFDAIASAPFIIPDEADDDDDQSDAQASQEDGQDDEPRGRRRRRRKRRGEKPTDATSAADKNDASYEDQGTSPVVEDAAEDAVVATASEAPETSNEDSGLADDHLADAVKAVVVEPAPESSDEVIVPLEDVDQPDNAAPVEATSLEKQDAPEADAGSEEVEPTPDQPDTPDTEEPELHSLHAATPDSEPVQRRKTGWWNKSG